MQDNNSVQNKIAFITGATSGIGKATAKELVLHSAVLILPIRNLEKGEALKLELLKLNAGCQIDLLTCDLDSIQSVRSMVKLVAKKYDHIDILINNAGIFLYERKETVDGHEQTFQVNVLAPFMITSALLELVKKSEQGRIINLSSTAHMGGRVNLADIEAKKRTGKGFFAGFQLYMDSNMERNMLTRYFAELLQATSVTVNCVHPGVVNTAITGQKTSIIETLFGSIFRVFGLSESDGAMPTLHLALSKIGGEVTGVYWSKFVQKPRVLTSIKPKAIEVLVAYCQKIGVNNIN